MSEMLIFEQSSPGRRAFAQAPQAADRCQIPSQLLRKQAPRLPEVSELQVVRHYTRLSQKNFSIDGQFYPLGSCTMKYNPRAAHKAALLPGFSQRHPYQPDHLSQGALACLYDLQEIIKDVTGMPGVSLSPMAGSQGELAGVAMIQAYHQSRGETERTEMLVPEAAHGTNPASAVMAGFTVKEVAIADDGDVDIAALKAAVGPKTAGIMLTNPSTCGVFERRIQEIAEIVHAAGGLLYYDGANLNAILGRVRPGDMGFDVMHLNLHKTFATPHGGGGPGSGPVAVAERLRPFLPIPLVAHNDQQGYYWAEQADYPQSIGRLSAFMGNVGINLRAYAYARLLGGEGMRRVSDYATLNANYLLAALRNVGFTPAYPERLATHEFILTLKEEAKNVGLTAMDLAKCLLDHNYHAPTTYFPLLVPECLLIEPTETESKETLDGFVAAMASILAQAQERPEQIKGAPYDQPVRRLDEVRAARQLDVAWQPEREA